MASSELTKDNKKPPSRKYYDRFELVDWFKQNKNIDVGPWLEAFAASTRKHNGALLTIENVKEHYVDTERFPEQFDTKAIQKAFDEVFGETSIEVKVLVVNLWVDRFLTVVMV